MSTTATTSQIYRPSLGLLTDLYQLTMAAGYAATGEADREAVFHLSFRKTPFVMGGEGGYAVACGLAYAVDFLRDFRFEAVDLEYLASLTGNDGGALFSDAFLARLAVLRLTCDVDAVPEGTVVFPHEPLVRVRGPLLEAQLLETALLNIVNFQTLIATKAARIARAAAPDPVLEFGLRRAQGIDGGLAASRAAYVGGCVGTSNVLAGRLFDIPVRGTHAHSWVMAFGDERTAFRRYADAMPNNCVFLVDTYDTVDGVRNAIRVGLELRADGHEMVGIRLDSGDLAELSIAARALLDEAGFPDAKVVASNDLDEHRVTQLRSAGARIDVWGIGTRLATAHDQPALGGVYKLAAIRGHDDAWEHRIKLSEQAIKVSIPGMQQVRRFVRDGVLVGDVIVDELAPCEDETVSARALRDSADTREFAGRATELLVPIMRGGELVHDVDTATGARERALAQLAMLPSEVARLDRPEPVFVGLETSLADRRDALIAAAQRGGETGGES